MKTITKFAAAAALAIATATAAFAADADPASLQLLERNTYVNANGGAAHYGHQSVARTYRGVDAFAQAPLQGTGSDTSAYDFGIASQH